MSRARLSLILMGLRGMTAARRERFTLDSFTRLGFTILAEHPNEELLIGLAGRFWSLSGGLRAVDGETFRTFDEPGSARAAWNFALTSGRDGATLLSTETRVQCTDARARRRFRVYWMVVRPFSGLIRRDMLRELKRQCEGAA